MSSSQSHRSIPSEDRVSSLPDSIISHILSFLPTKDSVATSVLSKRWNPLWLSVLDLNFDAQTFKDYVTFLIAVYSVIVSRDITLPIRSFRLKFGNEYDINDINRFIKAAIQRGIEELDIDMLEKVSGLTYSIFSCKTLTVLKLKNLSMKDHNCHVDLPILKVLFWGFHCKPYIAKIVSGCPILEEWQTENTAFYLRKFNPKTPNFFSRVEMMRLIKGNKRVLGVLQHTPNLQHLTIHQMESGIYMDDWQDPEIVPKCLSSQLRTCLFTGCRGRKCELQFIEYVMQNSKVLRTMTIRSACSIDLNAKHEMLRKLSVCPRGCKLIFD